MRQTEVLLELLRAAVLDRQPSIPKEVVIDWDALMDNASSHNVLTWVWDSVCKLPVEQQPPRQQRINWGLSAQEIWDAYFYQKKVLNEMLVACQKNNIRLLLLKGIGVSAIYPKPQSRPAGDIDIFLFDDFEKGRELFNENYCGTTPLHDKYDYKGVRIENHKIFVYPDTPVKQLVGQYLLNSLDKVVLTSEGYYTFAPLDCFVYLMMHTLNHIRFTSDEGLYLLKSIVDVLFFFNSYRDSFSPEEVLSLVKKLHLENSFEVMVFFTEWFLGVDCSLYHNNNIPPKKIEVIHELFLNGLAIDISATGSLFEQSKMLWKRYKDYMVLYRYMPRRNNSMFILTLKRQIDLVRSAFFKKWKIYCMN